MSLLGETKVVIPQDFCPKCKFGVLEKRPNSYQCSSSSCPYFYPMENEYGERGKTARFHDPNTLAEKRRVKYNKKKKWKNK